VLLLPVLRRRRVVMLVRLRVRRGVNRAHVHDRQLQECRGKPEAPEGGGDTESCRAHAYKYGD